MGHVCRSAGKLHPLLLPQCRRCDGVQAAIRKQSAKARRRRRALIAARHTSRPQNAKSLRPGEAFQKSDRREAALADQREHGVLWIGTLDDPVAVRRLRRPFEDLPAAGGYTACRRIEVADGEIMKPERPRQRRRLGQYAADCLSTRGEQLISAEVAAIGDGFTQTEKIAVELNRALAIVSEKLVPTDLAASTRCGGGFRPRAEPADQSEYRLLLVGDDRKAADVADIGRRYVDISSERHDLVAGCVNIADLHVAEPAR